MTATRLWQSVYRRRMSLELELCRACNESFADTFGHLQPASQGGPFSFKNITLLCFACNQLQADTVWPFLKSLAEEERRAPIEERWYRLALNADRAERRLSHRMDLSHLLEKLAPTPDWC